MVSCGTMATPESISTARFTVSMLVKFHHMLDAHAMVFEDFVQRAARGDVAVEADELLAVSALS